ncbi:orotate phosphoribosyltransferase [Xylona heveae TC161]|uniref:Orotate phosphoribosyltransferase n=1 Tax=Xylona heveae (strain CBS 132557 / TC161) TaxID=1328760 RepID=A0A165ITL2_XYLHT|nr:orotate phosphoribosyltransferase [Xylona heveae TC161]KZF25371.1 orotate phosphoribosyltransferase [Xylona heveae TC161]
MAVSSSQLPAYKTAFLNSCLSAQILKLGSFTLKSGRQSPYFFNAGLFHRADLLLTISDAYAQTIAAARSSGELGEFDVLFGPAYKGIPLATATVGRLAEVDRAQFGSLSYSFNRKEAKTHGEGGNIVGAPLKGKRVVVVDDVITAGTAIREAMDIIAKEGAILVGIIVALDRMERMPDPRGEKEGQELDANAPRMSAIGQVRKEYGVPVMSILTLDDIIEGLNGVGTDEDVNRLEEYRRRYRASD